MTHGNGLTQICRCLICRYFLAGDLSQPADHPHLWHALTWWIVFNIYCWFGGFAFFSCSVLLMNSIRSFMLLVFDIMFRRVGVWVLGDTSEFQPLWWNLYVSRLQAHSILTRLCIFPHTEDDSTIHIQTHLRVNLHSLAKSRTPRFSEILWDTPRYSASTTVVLLIPLFAHHCGCIYLFVLSVILYIIQDSS